MSNGNVNKVIIVGNLGHDPELKQTPKGNSVTTLSIATSRKIKRGDGVWQPATEWHRAVAWGNRAESCVRHLKKGNRVYIEGALQMRNWKGKNGEDRKSTEILVNDIKFLGFSNAYKINTVPESEKNLTE
jgi:single-strand DNA-binding protein